ncbi:MAG: hypothetical protein D6752_01825 [Candidatus Nitrosothermus koennekii]|nr:MAG: hypothetical protein D6752_01825 [Candidatus Nitrosothermus koennekii]
MNEYNAVIYIKLAIHIKSMKVELEFKIDSNDKAEILSKLVEVVKIAQQQGLELEEIEIEREDED